MAAPAKPVRTKPRVPLVELGDTGLKRHSGLMIWEEYLTQLQGDRALKIYSEMRDTALISGILNAIEMLARQASWRIEPATGQTVDQDAAEFVDQCFHDMSHSWGDLLSEILSMLWAGWSYHEIVYKLRQGPQDGPGASSAFSDGKVGWRKLPIRSQDSRYSWEIDAHGGIRGMWQMPWQGGLNKVYIPIEKALLFRPAAYKNNPEGRSLLRGCYREYWFTKRLQEFESIGIERDLAGLPVLRIPSEVMADGTQMGNWKQMVVDVRRGEQEGVVIPSDRDEETGNYLYEFELLTSGGERQHDTSSIVDRYDVRIAQSMLADFLHLGQGETGTKGLGRTKLSLFTTALQGWLDDIADTFNRHAIPRLLRVNAIEVEEYPCMVFDPVDVGTFTDVAEAIQKLAMAGFTLFPRPAMENVLLQRLGLPQMTDEEIAERELDAERAEAQAEEQKLIAARTLAEARVNGDSENSENDESEPMEEEDENDE